MRHHLAVLYRTYITQIIRGRKTVECRLGQMGYPPHGQVEPGDLVWLKEVSGPVRAVVRVSGVRSIRLSGTRVLERVRREWNQKILAPASFWKARRQASVATLIELGDLCAFHPFRIVKPDQRAWVSLSHPPVPNRPLRGAPRGKAERPGTVGSHSGHRGQRQPRMTRMGPDKTGMDADRTPLG